MKRGCKRSFKRSFNRRFIGVISLLICLFLWHGMIQAAEPFELHVLDVGQGQGILVEADGHYMLVDGGGRMASSFVVSYLKERRISKLDCVIASHYDEDHMAGLVGVLSAFPDDLFLAPDYAGQGALYDSLASAALSNGCVMMHARSGMTFGLGGARVEIVGPVSAGNANENDRSVAVRISYGDTAYLICGDTEQQGEMDMVASRADITADLYVVNHHGSSTSSIDAFLDAVTPTYAVISCGTGNAYGHPSIETMQRLQSREIQMYRTDRQGTIVAYSDGEDIWMSTYPCEDWSAGTLTSQEERTVDTAAEGSLEENEADELLIQAQPKEMQDASMQYVCNTSTKKFHYPDCKSVSQMKEENRLYTELSREELIAEGYKPCGNCKP